VANSKRRLLFLPNVCYAAYAVCEEFVRVIEDLPVSLKDAAGELTNLHLQTELCLEKAAFVT
jgi:hypothetical protein